MRCSGASMGLPPPRCAGVAAGAGRSGLLKERCAHPFPLAREGCGGTHHVVLGVPLPRLRPRFFCCLLRQGGPGGAVERRHPSGLSRCATGGDRVCVIACATAPPHVERCLQSPRTRSGLVVVLAQQVVFQTWIEMAIMPCLAQLSRSSPPRLTHAPHVDHHLAIARDGRSDHALVRTVLGQEKPG
jgi:hypothetical protein